MSERIGPYRIERELARGGMGVVFAARHEQLGRRVALKLVLGDALADEQLRRFQTEAEMVARLRHPGIVDVHQLGVHQGRPYLALEFIEGESLAQRLKREGPFSPLEAVRLVQEVAKALAYAHGQGVLHRDLKPANVLLSQDGRALITDFGLAKDLSETRERLTRTGQMLGTPAYMPPEQADGQVHLLDARTDVYSLGATLYALLTGRPPFEGDTPLNIVHKVLLQTPVWPSQHVPTIPPALDAICLKALAKEQAERYPSAEAFAAELGRFLAGEDVEAKLSRRAVGRWVALLATLVVGVSIAVFAVLPEADSSSRAPEAPPSPQPAPSTEEEEGLQKIREELDPFAALLAREAWLDRFPEHADAAALRDQLDADLKRPIASFDVGDDLLGSAFAGPGRLLTTHAPREGATSLRIWDASSGDALDSSFEGEASLLEVSPDAALAVVSSGKRIVVVDPQTGAIQRRSDPLPLGSILALSVDWEQGRVVVGGQLAAGEESGTLFVLRLADLSVEDTRPSRSKHAVVSLAWEPGGRWFGVGTSGEDPARVFGYPGLRGSEFPPLDPPENWKAPLPSGGVTAVAFWPNAPVQLSPFTLMTLGTRTGRIYAWIPYTGEPPRTGPSYWTLGKGSQPIVHAGGVRHLAFSQDGARLYSVGGAADGSSELKVWSIAYGGDRQAPVFSLAAAAPGDVALSPEERRVVSSVGPRVEIWPLPRRAQPLVLHAPWTDSLALVGEHLLVTSHSTSAPERSSVSSWDLASGSLEWTWDLGHRAYAMSTRPDGKRAVIGCQGRLLLVDLEAREVLRELETKLLAVAVAPDWDAKTLAVALAKTPDRSQPKDSVAVSLHSLETLEQIRSLGTFQERVNSLAWAPRGAARLAIGSGITGEDRRVRVVRPGGSDVAQVVMKDGAACVAWESSGEHLAIGSYGGEVFLWTPGGGDPLLIFSPPEKKSASRTTLKVTGLAFGPGDDVLYATNRYYNRQPNFRAWKIPWEDGELPTKPSVELADLVPQLHSTPLFGMALGPKGRRIAAWNQTRVQVWTLTSTATR